LIDGKFRRNAVGWSKFRRKVLAHRHTAREMKRHMKQYVIKRLLFLVTSSVRCEMNYYKRLSFNLQSHQAI